MEGDLEKLFRDAPDRVASDPAAPPSRLTCQRTIPQVAPKRAEDGHHRRSPLLCRAEMPDPHVEEALRVSPNPGSKPVSRSPAEPETRIQAWNLLSRWAGRPDPGLEAAFRLSTKAGSKRVDGSPAEHEGAIHTWKPLSSSPRSAPAARQTHGHAGRLGGLPDRHGSQRKVACGQSCQKPDLVACRQSAKPVVMCWETETRAVRSSAEGDANADAALP